MKLKKYIKYIFVVFLLLYLSFDAYIYFKYNDSETAKLITWETRMYSSIPDDSIPDNIINAYNKVFPNTLTNKIYPDILWCVFASRNDNSYVQINLAYDISITSGFKVISIANQLDNKLTQKQCIYAYLSRFDFLNLTRGIKKAAKRFYNKDIFELNERECIELVVMTKNPSQYNKLRHPDKLNKEVNRIMGI